VSVMRLNAKKRPLALLDLIANTPESVRLRIVGDGPLRARLVRSIARRGLASRVELLGHRTREEIRALFAMSDVFVLPSVRESFGLAALEGRCAGLPVVAMAQSGVAELIAHGREGLLAQSDGEFVEHVGTLARDYALRERIAANNRDTTPRADWSSVLPAHLEVYTSAIARADNIA
jgi:glycosyltransferase involved in cell wall biosynthesis